MQNFRFLSWFIVAVTLAGCSTPRVPPEIAAPYDPTFAILHYPFGAPGKPGVARPQPDRSGWTNGRMDLDLRRMRDARLDLVFVVLDASRVQPFQMERVSQFVRLAADLEGAPRVSLWLRAAGTPASELRRLISQLVQTGAPNSRAWFRLDQRPLLVLDEADNSPPRHPALTIRDAGNGPDTWVAPKGPQQQARFGASGQQALVSAGYWDANSRKWIVEREKGRTFRQQLWSAARRRPQFIIVSSWDAFHRGDFLMPNSLDGETAYQHLVKEGRWLWQLSGRTRTAGGF